MARTKSALSRKRAAMRVPECPPVPRASSWSSGKTLLAAMVVITGTAASSAKAASSSQARAHKVPWPARITGRSARSRAAARSRTSSSSPADRSSRGGSYSRSGASSPDTSPGISTSTGPGRPWRICEKATRISSETRPGWLMLAAHLVTLRYPGAASKLGWTWVRSLGGPPGSSSSGIESAKAWADPG